jgi:hypothetical protein
MGQPLENAASREGQREARTRQFSGNFNDQPPDQFLAALVCLTPDQDRPGASSFLLPW